MIKITLPDGSIKEYDSGVTPFEVARSISEGLARNVISAKFDETIVETTTPLENDGALILYTWSTNEGKKAFWHSSAHILAQALEQLYPNVKLWVGPAIENGFYYDVDLGDETLSEKDFKSIEEDLPKRFAEFGTVYRYEQSGELHGLTRVRGFTQDDAHIFCTADQLDQEFKNVIDLSLYVLGSLGFENFTAQVSVRDLNTPEKYIGSVENWEKAENAIINAAKEKDLDFIIETGEAAFYGPKLDFMVKDALGRQWQLGTIQVDYNLPERFDLTYKGSDNESHRPVMIHRAPFGSMERFIALLLEHTGGNFPLWLIPEQAIVLPVSEKHEKYAEKVLKSLENSEIRALIDSRNETVGKKIREAEMQKVPFMLIVGENEEAENTISVRKHGGEDLGSITLKAFEDLVTSEINSTLKSF
ncbi:UNVERIFIED_CONTAM: hypothetical protein GTU68_010087 [Idotea baltica]|nr:hypothetical protein [Idotea baltica]